LTTNRQVAPLTWNVGRFDGASLRQAKNLFMTDLSQVAEPPINRHGKIDVVQDEVVKFETQEWRRLRGTHNHVGVAKYHSVVPLELDKFEVRLVCFRQAKLQNIC
jgi:hypothetical protein